MSLFVASLNSGSNGNCYYVANEREAIFVDAGISCKEIEKRMDRLALPMERLKAIFISHEHSDHINGVEVLSKKYNLPVYINDKTYRNSRLKIDKKRESFKAHQQIQIGDLTIVAFPKFHDASDPCSFIISGNDVTIGVLTDIGSICDHVIEHFSQCHAAFLEANYDEEMLDNGHYPLHLKRGIKSDVGHLSNDQALELFADHRSSSLSHVFLSHLSKENNSPELAQKLFQKYAGKTEVVVASRYEESKVYEITNEFVSDVFIKRERILVRENPQLKLF